MLTEERAQLVKWDQVHAIVEVDMAGSLHPQLRHPSFKGVREMGGRPRLMKLRTSPLSSRNGSPRATGGTSAPVAMPQSDWRSVSLGCEKNAAICLAVSISAIRKVKALAIASKCFDSIISQSTVIVEISAPLMS